MPTPTSSDRQRRTVIALAAVLALLAAVGVGVLLGTGGDDDVDRLATPTTSPTPSATPSPTPTPSPSPSPSPSPTPSPTAADPAWAPEDAFVTPEAASEAEEPGWEVVGTEGSSGPLLDPCDDGTQPSQAAVQASAEQALESVREVGGSSLEQEVLRYASGQDAAAAFGEHRQRVEQCPRAPVEQTGDEIERTVVDDASGQDRLLVRERYCNPGCTDIATTYAMVVLSGDGLSVLRYAVGEDGDPADGARALLDAAATALQSAVPA